MPGSVTKGKSVGVDQRVAISGRIGAAGVYVASCEGYPVCQKAILWRAGGGRPLRVGGGRDIEDIHVSPGPQGRLWVAWHDGRTDQILAVRTNRAATRVGPLVEVKPPPGAKEMWKLTGEGSRGKLDLFVAASVGSTLSTWHTQVLPPLEITVSTSASKARVRVGDAGARSRAPASRWAGRR